MAPELFNSSFNLLQSIVSAMAANLSVLNADQVVQLRQFFAEGYAQIDDYLQRHIDGDNPAPF